MTAAPPARDAVIWHELECGAYAADLGLWEKLGAECGGPILDLGCGVGRVALHLARRGHEVVGLDREGDLLAALREQRGERRVETVLGDATDFDLGREFGAVLAPMQLLQLLESAEERIACLRCAEGHLRPGGTVAAAIVESLPPALDGASPLPDARELDGWVYSSLPLQTQLEPAAMLVRRLRQTVSPGGELSEAVDEVRLRRLDAAALEREARAARLRPAGRAAIEPTAEHVGSTVVLLEGGR